VGNNKRAESPDTTVNDVVNLSETESFTGSPTPKRSRLNIFRCPSLLPPSPTELELEALTAQYVRLLRGNSTLSQVGEYWLSEVSYSMTSAQVNRVRGYMQSSFQRADKLLLATNALLPKIRNENFDRYECAEELAGKVCRMRYLYEEMEAMLAGGVHDLMTAAKNGLLIWQ